jgi:hypothetical protein
MGCRLSLKHLAQEGPLIIDKTDFAVAYHSILLQMDELTDHQKEKFGDHDSACSTSTSLILKLGHRICLVNVFIVDGTVG